MKNLSLAMKMTVGFGTVLLLSAALGIYLLMSLNRINDDTTTVADVLVMETDGSSELETAARVARLAATEFINSYQEQAFSAYQSAFRVIEEKYRGAEEFSRKYPGRANLRTQVGILKGNISDFGSGMTQLQTATKNMATQRAVFGKAGIDTLKQIENTLKVLSELLDKDIKAVDMDRASILRRTHAVSLFNDLYNEIAYLRYQFLAALEVKSPERARESLARLDAAEKIAQEIEGYIVAPAVVQGLAKVKENIISYRKFANDFLKEFATLPGLTRRAMDAAAAVADTSKNLLDSTLRDTREASQDVSNRADVSARNAMYGTIIVTLIGILLSILITKTITGPLTKSLGFAQDVAAGNLDSKLDIDSTDEVGRLADALRTMVRSLKEKIAEANEKSENARVKGEEARVAMMRAEEAQRAAESAKRDGMLQAASKLEGVVEVISSAAEELSAQIEQSDRGAAEQSSRVNETAVSMEQMNASVLEVARNAGTTSEVSNNARKKAEEGAGIVRSVVAGIADVQKQSLELKADMGDLGNQADSIGQIMNVISDIADQTNLLALNAAIEAARAGEAGRGFAVVADEVRKLAENTMKATQEVGSAIRGIQNGATKNINNVERSVKSIEDATSMAHKSGEALMEIVKLVENASDQVRGIATAAEEQSAASEQVTHAVEQVRTISAETSQAMGEAARAVAELSTQAQVLRRLVEELKRS